MAQRERWSSRESSPLVLDGRETSSRTSRHVSWVDEVRQEMQEREASEICVSSMEDPVDSSGFSTVIEEATKKEIRFDSVTEGVASEEDQIA